MTGPCKLLPLRRRCGVGQTAYKQTQRCKLKGHGLWDQKVLVLNKGSTTY